MVGPPVSSANANLIHLLSARYIPITIKYYRYANTRFREPSMIKLFRKVCHILYPNHRLDAFGDVPLSAAHEELKKLRQQLSEQRSTYKELERNFQFWEFTHYDFERASAARMAHDQALRNWNDTLAKIRQCEMYIEWKMDLEARIDQDLYAERRMYRNSLVQRAVAFEKEILRREHERNTRKQKREMKTWIQSRGNELL